MKHQHHIGLRRKYNRVCSAARKAVGVVAASLFALTIGLDEPALSHLDAMLGLFVVTVIVAAVATP